jgi:hypothetical protein
LLRLQKISGGGSAVTRQVRERFRPSSAVTAAEAGVTTGKQANSPALHNFVGYSNFHKLIHKSIGSIVEFRKKH